MKRGGDRASGRLESSEKEKICYESLARFGTMDEMSRLILLSFGCSYLLCYILFFLSLPGFSPVIHYIGSFVRLITSQF